MGAACTRPNQESVDTPSPSPLPVQPAPHKHALRHHSADAAAEEDADGQDQVRLQQVGVRIERSRNSHASRCFAPAEVANIASAAMGTEIRSPRHQLLGLPSPNKDGRPVVAVSLPSIFVRHARGSSLSSPTRALRELGSEESSINTATTVSNASSKRSSGEEPLGSKRSSGEELAIGRQGHSANMRHVTASGVTISVFAEEGQSPTPQPPATVHSPLAVGGASAAGRSARANTLANRYASLSPSQPRHRRGASGTGNSSNGGSMSSADFTRRLVAAGMGPTGAVGSARYCPLSETARRPPSASQPQIASAPLQSRRLNSTLAQSLAPTAERSNNAIDVRSSNGKPGEPGELKTALSAPSTSPRPAADAPEAEAAATAAASAATEPAAAAVVPTGVAASAATVTRAEEAPLITVHAPVFAHATASVEHSRSLNACLAAPRLMSAEEYRAQYPAYDAHNPDYMAYRARWEAAAAKLAEAASVASTAPGASPGTKSRSLLCTPSRQVRTLAENSAAAGTTALDGSPLSPFRTLSPSCHGAFGYEAQHLAGEGSSPVPGFGSRNSGGSPSASLQRSTSGQAPLYLPPPTFHEDLPQGFVAESSVLAFMVESSRPASLRSTPVPGFRMLVRPEACATAGSGSDAGTPTQGQNGASGEVTARRLRLDTESDGASITVELEPASSVEPSPQSRLEGLYAGSGAGSDASGFSSHVDSPLAQSFRPKQFTSHVQVQLGAFSTSKPFVPVLPASHAEADWPRTPESGLVALAAARAAAHAAATESAATATDAIGRRSFSDGTVLVSSLPHQQQQPSQETLPSPRYGRACGELVQQHSGGGLRPSSRAVPAGTMSNEEALGSSLPGTPSESEGAEGAGTPSLAQRQLHQPSAAVLRSQAHIAAITRSWQERVPIEGSGGSPFGSSVEASSSAGGRLLPAVAGAFPVPGLSHSPGHHTRHLSLGKGSPRSGLGSVVSSVNASGGRLGGPVATRMRAIKCILPSDRLMGESTPVSLPPPHSPGGGGAAPSSAGMSIQQKRRLRLSTAASAGTMPALSSPSASAGSTSSVAGSEFVTGCGSPSSRSGSSQSPQQLQRRRLLMQQLSNSGSSAGSFSTGASPIMATTTLSAGAAVGEPFSSSPRNARVAFVAHRRTFSAAGIKANGTANAAATVAATIQPAMTTTSTASSSSDGAAAVATVAEAASVVPAPPCAVW